MSNQKTNGNGTTGTLPEEQVRHIGLADLSISEQNTRQPKPAEVQELALSMKETGQTTPAIVRPHPKHKGKFEIMAGARRFVAARVNGWQTLAAVVRDLDDNTFEEQLLVENLQREDPDPRAEVELIDRLIKRGIHTPEQISAHLGKSQHWAERRVQLLKVIPELRKQWAARTNNSNTSLEHFSVEMMELVGSLPVETQRLFLDRDNWRLRRCATRPELRKALDEAVFCRLDKAPFDLNDKRTFVKGCGPGCACDSSALQTLFDDGKKEAARCLKPECFRQRAAIARGLQFKELAGKEDLPVVTMGGEFQGGRLQVGSKAVEVRHFFGYEASLEPKEEKGAKKVVAVDGAGNMRVAWLKQKSKSGATKEKVKPSSERLAERKLILQGKRWLIVHEELDKALLKSKHTQCTENVIDLVCIFGLPFKAEPWAGSEYWKYLDARKGKGFHYETREGRNSIVEGDEGYEKVREAALWHGVVNVLRDVMRPKGNVGNYPKSEPDMRRVAKLIKFPIDAKKREADEKVRPPKTWGAVDIHTLEPVSRSKELKGLGVTVSGRTKAFIDRMHAKAKARIAARLAGKKASPKKAKTDKTKAKKK